MLRSVVGRSGASLGVVLGAMAAGAVGALLGGCSGRAGGSSGMVRSESFGMVDTRGGEQEVDLYTLRNDSGSVAKITNFGGVVTELWVPDREGRLEDVALGLDTAAEYRERSPYFGAMVGRVGNRIAGGRFELDGQTYQLATNNGPNHLHGGEIGFDKVVWDAEPFEAADGPGLRLTYVSPDGEEGYPGTLTTVVEYVLTHDNELRVETEARTDAPTPVNIVHHSYWNLAGHDSGTILDHELMLACSRYTPTDATLIPTGEIAPVAGTPFDFRTAKRIGRDIGRLPGDGADNPGGYDVNFVVDGEPGRLRRVARVHEPTSGRVMEIWSDQPGVQFYSGNFLSGDAGKDGAVYEQHSGFCLETQTFPDSINRQGEPGWPDVVLRPGEVYRHVMIHRFGAE